MSSSDDDIDREDNITGKKRKRVHFNGRSVSRRLDSESKIWFLTWNSYPTDWEESLESIDGLTKWCCQEETAESGQKHIQGVLMFTKKYKWSLLHELIREIHWEVCRNLVSAKKYCSKLKTRTGKTWVSGFRVPLVVKDPLEGKELYHFQKQIIQLVKTEPDERTIYWYWSRKGNIGKSSLCKHLCLKYNAIALGGKVGDAMYAVAKLVEAGRPPKIIIFDVARSDAANLNYVSLENLKNGCFFSPKYESVMVMLNVMHVIVFANERPHTSKLSSDRWVIKNLDEEQDLPGTGVDFPMEI